MLKNISRTMLICLAVVFLFLFMLYILSITDYEGAHLGMSKPDFETCIPLDRC